MSQVSSDQDVLAILFPGRQVEIVPPEEGKHGGLSVKVYPMGVSQLTRFRERVNSMIAEFAASDDDGKLANLLGAVKSIVSDKGAPSDDGGGDVFDSGLLMKLIGQVPLASMAFVDLIDECVDGLDLTTGGDRLPHWVLPKIGAVWIEESFLGDPGKALRPWLESLELLFSKLTGKNLAIWDSLSPALSKLASPSERSSTTDSPDSGTPAGPSHS